MLTKNEATLLAASYVQQLQTTLSGELVLLEEKTKEFRFGWVFFYQSLEFVRTGDIFTSLGGNAPLIVDKRDGSVHLPGTAFPFEYYVEEYARQHG